MSRYVSDALVEVLSELGCTYLPLNPGSSFRGLHDSLASNDKGSAPEIILCTHEEIAVSMAHAYAKATGRVGFAAVHDLVGLMHATMAVYDAWCDRTPLVVLGGGGPADPEQRRPIDWFHSANTQSGLVRPFVKWDDDPITPQATIDSVLRCHRIAGSAPMGPTYVSIDASVQEKPDPGVQISVPSPRHELPFVARAEDLAETAEELREADFPLVVAGGVGLDPRSTRLLVEMMELLGCAGRDERSLNSIPTAHQLCLNDDSWALEMADVILAVDMHDIRWLVSQTDGTPRVIDLSTRSLGHRSWANLDHLGGHARSLVSDPIQGLEGLLAHLTKHPPTSGQEQRRSLRLEELAGRRSQLDEERSRTVKEHWDDSPISAHRLVSEVYDAVKDLPWLLTLRNTRSWPEGIWQFDRAGRYLGHSGGGGMGYGPGALLGGGLAARDRGEFPVGIIGDGDLMFAPGAIWTAVHHEIPMLVVINNNRTYLNDEQHQTQVAKMRDRPVENAEIGTTITDPDIHFADLARSQGAWAAGPVSDPSDLARALDQAVAQVAKGQVAVVDIHTGK